MAFGALAAGGGALAAEGPRIEVAEISSPAEPGARQPVLATAPDGAVWMAWWEPSPDGRTALRCSAFDVSRLAWGPGRTIVRSPTLDPDQPAALTAGAAGHLAVACSGLGGTGPGRVLFCQSADGGLTWSDPVLLTKESDRVYRVSLAFLADGTVLAAWVDGRAAGPGGAARLYIRFATGPHAGAPDWLLAADAWSGGAPDLAAFLDGGALLAYQDRAGETGPSLARLHGLHWQRSQPFAAAGRMPSGVSDLGPRLAVDGGRVALLWSAVAPEGPAIQASTSPDAGARFLRPKAVGFGRSAGHPDAALLHDGAVLAAWLEGGLQLRRLSPEFQVGAAVALGTAARSAEGSPRLAVARDYAGDAGSAQVLLVFAGGPTAPGLHTLLVTVPEGALLAAASDSCNCAPTPLQLRGFSLRGTLIAAAPDGALTWETDAVPGVLEPGRHRFFATPAVRGQLRPGDTYLARIERRGADWWIFDARRLEEP